MYNSKSTASLWRRGKIVQMPARGRGNGAWVRMPMDAFTSMPTVIGSKSTGNLRPPMAEQGKFGPCSDQPVYGIRPNTALNRNYKPGRILEDGRVAT